MVRPGHERGPWYDIKVVADVIRSKEATGEDASFERGLLKSWAKFPGYQGAAVALKGLNHVVQNSKTATIPLDVTDNTQTTVLTHHDDTPRHRGRPLKIGEVHRTTAYRREVKVKQLELVTAS